MKRRRLLLPLLALSLLGCQYDLQGRLINDTGQTITLRANGKEQVIEAGGSADTDLTALANHGGGAIEIHTAGCRLVYVVMQGYGMPAGYPWPVPGSHRLVLQIEPDLLLYAVPPDSDAPLPSTSIKQTQQGVFPLHPASRLCA